MKRLLLLIREYEKTLLPRPHDVFPRLWMLMVNETGEHLYVKGQGYRYCEAFIISKDYGFIKYLRDNNLVSRWNSIQHRTYKSLLGELAGEDKPLEYLLENLETSH